MSVRVFLPDTPGTTRGCNIESSPARNGVCRTDVLVWRIGQFALCCVGGLGAHAFCAMWSVCEDSAILNPLSTSMGAFIGISCAELIELAIKSVRSRCKNNSKVPLEGFPGNPIIGSMERSTSDEQISYRLGSRTRIPGVVDSGSFFRGVDTPKLLVGPDGAVVADSGVGSIGESNNFADVFRLCSEGDCLELIKKDGQFTTLVRLAESPSQVFVAKLNPIDASGNREIFLRKNSLREVCHRERSFVEALGFLLNVVVLEFTKGEDGKTVITNVIGNSDRVLGVRKIEAIGRDVFECMRKEGGEVCEQQLSYDCGRKMATVIRVSDVDGQDVVWKFLKPYRDGSGIVVVEKQEDIGARILYSQAKVALDLLHGVSGCEVADRVTIVVRQVASLIHQNLWCLPACYDAVIVNSTDKLSSDGISKEIDACFNELNASNNVEVKLTVVNKHCVVLADREQLINLIKYLTVVGVSLVSASGDADVVMPVRIDMAKGLVSLSINVAVLSVDPAHLLETCFSPESLLRNSAASCSYDPMLMYAILRVVKLMDGKFFVTRLEAELEIGFRLNLEVVQSPCGVSECQEFGNCSSPFRDSELCVLVVDDNKINRMTNGRLVAKSIFEACRTSCVDVGAVTEKQTVKDGFVTGTTVSVLENPIVSCEIHFCCDGNEAVQFCLKRAPSMIFMDFSMPNKDGLTATGEILAKHENCPIVGCSSNISEIERKKGKDAGMLSVLKKPATSADFQRVILESLGKKS